MNAVLDSGLQGRIDHDHATAAGKSDLRQTKRSPAANDGRFWHILTGHLKTAVQTDGESGKIVQLAEKLLLQIESLVRNSSAQDGLLGGPAAAKLRSVMLQLQRTLRSKDLTVDGKAEAVRSILSTQMISIEGIKGIEDEETVLAQLIETLSSGIPEGQSLHGRAIGGSEDPATVVRVGEEGSAAGRADGVPQAELGRRAGEPRDSSRSGPAERDRGPFELRTADARAADARAADADSGSQKGERQVNERTASEQKIRVTDLRTERGSTGKPDEPGQPGHGRLQFEAIREQSPASTREVDLRTFVQDGQPSTAETREGTYVSRQDAPVLRGAFSQTALMDSLHDAFQSGFVRRNGIILRDGENGEIRLVLKPESLGSVRVRVSISENRIEGRIIVENSSVREIIESNIDGLKRALLADGFGSSSIEVSVGGDRPKDHRRGGNEPSAYVIEAIDQMDKRPIQTGISGVEDLLVNLMV